MSLDRSQLLDGARAFGVALDDAQVRAFETYFAELLAWNEKVNLTAITEAAEVVSKHFLDSLSLFALAERYPLLAQPDLSLLDVGTGAGLPALALKIARPGWRVTLLEATRKKCDFLEQVVATLQLAHTRVVWGRAEAVAHEAAEREQYDLVAARAIAEMDTLTEYLLPFARVGGLCVAWKGDAVLSEVNAAKGAMEKLGGRLGTVKQVHVPGIEQKRHLVAVEKVAPTPEKYPRREGLPAKKPLR